MIFRRKRIEDRRLTGARTILKADHRDQATGVVHGHTWEVIAWWQWDGTSAEVCQRQLEETLKGFQGKCLPDSLAWAENLAAHVGRNMEYGWSSGDPRVVAVDIARHKEGLLARWERGQ